MTTVLSNVVLLALIIYVFVPFLTSKKLPDKFKTKKHQRKADLLARIDGLHGNLRDIENDFGAGMVEEKDYKIIKRGYEARIEALSAELNARGGAVKLDDVDQLIEKEVAKRRGVSTIAMTVECASCNKAIAPGVKFCPECGASQSKS